MDKWLYPEDLDNENLVVNIFGDKEERYEANFHSLPEDWKERVTQNNGKDGKPGIHNLMEEAEQKERIKKLTDGIEYAINELKEWNADSEGAKELEELLKEVE